MDDIVAYSRERIERGSKSFAVAARLFDADTRAQAYMLYAWCRHCDDVIDGQDHGHAGPAGGAGAGSAVALRQLEAETRAALAGQPVGPVFVALSRVVETAAIPHRHPLELLAGFEMDVAGRHYQTIEGTLEYCYHVAGVVGVMMARVMGVTELAALQRAQDLGIAFQLTNIARDVVEDARLGRVYLPAAWLADVGLQPATLADPEERHKLSRVVERLLDVAAAYYDSADYGLPALPIRAAWAVASARSIYRGIGTLVRGRGPAAWDQRAVVGRGGKLAALAAGLGAVAVSRAVRLTGRPAPPRNPLLWTKDDLGRD